MINIKPPKAIDTLKQLFVVHLLLVLLAPLGVLHSAESTPGLKIGVVSLPGVMAKSKDAEEVTIKLQKEFTDREQTLVASRKVLAKLEDKLKNDALTMTQTERRGIERDITSKRTELTQDVTAFREDSQIRQNEEQQIILKKMQKVIRNFAEDEKFGLILNGQAVIHASDTLDITNDIIQRMNKS